MSISLGIDRGLCGTSLVVEDTKVDGFAITGTVGPNVVLSVAALK